MSNGTPFQRAEKAQRPLKLALFGPSGSGKTFSALKIATAMGGTIAMIDTERASASLYAGDFEFDTVSLTTYTVDAYVDLIVQAAGYDTLIIDSLSHAWEGPGGILDEVDRIKTRKNYRDSMRAWNDVKPVENRLWAAILDSPCNTIITMRSKTVYDIDKDDKGKLQVEKLGLAPIQRADKEYEMDVVGRMDMDNTMIIEKTRCTALKRAGGIFKEPGENVAAILRIWLSDGKPLPPAAPATPRADGEPAAEPGDAHDDLTGERQQERQALFDQIGKAMCERKVPKHVAAAMAGKPGVEMTMQEIRDQLMMVKIDGDLMVKLRADIKEAVEFVEMKAAQFDAIVARATENIPYEDLDVKGLQAVKEAVYEKCGGA